MVQTSRKSVYIFNFLFLGVILLCHDKMKWSIEEYIKDRLTILMGFKWDMDKVNSTEII